MRFKARIGIRCRSRSTGVAAMRDRLRSSCAVAPCRRAGPACLPNAARSSQQDDHRPAVRTFRADVGDEHTRGVDDLHVVRSAMALDETPHQGSSMRMLCSVAQSARASSSSRCRDGYPSSADFLDGPPMRPYRRPPQRNTGRSSGPGFHMPSLRGLARALVVKPESRRDAALHSVRFPNFHKKCPLVSGHSRGNPHRLVGAIGLEPTTPTMSRMWSWLA